MRSTFIHARCCYGTEVRTGEVTSGWVFVGAAVVSYESGVAIAGLAVGSDFQSGCRRRQGGVRANDPRVSHHWR